MNSRMGAQISAEPYPQEHWGSSEGLPYRPFTGQKLPYQSMSFGSVSVDWKETEEAHVFKANVPGLKKEDVNVEIWKGSILRISGERKRSGDVDQKTDMWHLVERSSGKFDRRIWLPENVKVDEVKAAVEDGVLTVTLLKIDPLNKGDVRSIPISG